MSKAIWVIELDVGTEYEIISYHSDYFEAITEIDLLDQIDMENLGVCLDYRIRELTKATATA